jgi:hypothetical protein
MNAQEFERWRFCHNRVDQKTNKHGGCDRLQAHASKVRLRDLARLRQQICLGGMFYKALMTRGEPNPVL